MRTSWLLILTCHEISCCKYELLVKAKNRWLYNTVAMEMFVVFNIPLFCSLDSFASHLFRVFVHSNTIKKQGISRDLRSPSAIFCLVFVEISEKEGKCVKIFFNIWILFFFTIVVSPRSEKHSIVSKKDLLEFIVLESSHWKNAKKRKQHWNYWKLQLIFSPKNHCSFSSSKSLSKLFHS